ncbi:uncharacterized protein B0T23DRAFT_453679 [Neurospora hispaniola]|uniref:Uncharacterized protein n=1 Tax=Neurospora hispaniola TaxID=588809 RepID=A0AAJ0I7Z2_9PEZI|nr:hypothetical protein B0T23DRAFT_453679 [Neurospora hispaniola]
MRTISNRTRRRRTRRRIKRIFTSASTIASPPTHPRYSAVSRHRLERSSLPRGIPSKEAVREPPATRTRYNFPHAEQRDKEYEEQIRILGRMKPRALLAYETSAALCREEKALTSGRMAAPFEAHIHFVSDTAFCFVWHRCRRAGL